MTAIPRKCRRCGCSDYDPCLSETGEACAWVSPDLCDFCATDAIEEFIAGAYIAHELARSIPSYPPAAREEIAQAYRECCEQMDLNSTAKVVAAGHASLVSAVAAR